MTLPQQPPTGMMEWIEWKGGDCPVEPHTLVDYLCRGESPTGFVSDVQPACNVEWAHSDPDPTGEGADIIAYRIVEPGK